jgi:Na+-transporting NADH:ubiquinone oxidoreductase subunit NqrD
MRALFTQPENERHATLAAVNLFFGVLLGANLGSINSVPLFDYIKLVLLLGGSVMALFTIAVSTRWRTVTGLAITYALLLGLTIVDADMRPEGMESEMERIIATLGIWFLFVVLVRLTPLLGGGSAIGLSLREDIDLPEAAPVANALPTASAEGPNRTS